MNPTCYCRTEDAEVATYAGNLARQAEDGFVLVFSSWSGKILLISKHAVMVLEEFMGRSATVSFLIRKQLNAKLNVTERTSSRPTCLIWLVKAVSKKFSTLFSIHRELEAFRKSFVHLIAI